jgi:hypothetical protein
MNDERFEVNRLIEEFSRTKKYYSSLSIELLFIDSIWEEKVELHNMTASQIILWYLGEYKDWTFSLRDEMIINEGIAEFCFQCRKYGILPGFRFKGNACKIKVSCMITKYYFKNTQELELAINEIVTALEDDKFTLMHTFMSDFYDFYNLIRKEYFIYLNRKFESSLMPLIDEMEQDLQLFFDELKERNL